MNCLRKDFIGFGNSRSDDGEGLSHARGGVAIFYKKEISKFAKQIDTNLDWCNALEITVESHKIIIINV